jgi:hypothetical protein
MPLTMRNTTVSFVEERLRDITEEQRVLFRDLFLELFHDALVPRRDTRHADYAPQPVTVPRRPAVYSANLVLLLLLTGGELTGDELFPAASDPVAERRRTALLSRSRLPPEGRLAFVEFLDLDRVWEGDRRRLPTATPAAVSVGSS